MVSGLKRSLKFKVVVDTLVPMEPPSENCG